jgi:hypothetical protein
VGVLEGDAEVGSFDVGSTEVGCGFVFDNEFENLQSDVQVPALHAHDDPGVTTVIARGEQVYGIAVGFGMGVAVGLVVGVAVGLLVPGTGVEVGERVALGFGVAVGGGVAVAVALGFGVAVGLVFPVPPAALTALKPFNLPEPSWALAIPAG